MYRVVELLNQRRRFRDAQEVIQKFQGQAQSAFTREFGQLASEVSIHTGNFLQAIELARQTAAAQPSNFRHLLWLGQTLVAAGKPEEAEKSLRQAVYLDVRQPEPWVALVYFLARTGSLDEARAAIEDARQRLPAQQAPLALAQCYETVGQTQDAEQSYRQALELDPEESAVRWSVAGFYLRSGQSLKAEPVLRSLINVQSKTPETIRRAARRALALVLISRNGFSNFREAISLIEQNMGQSNGVPEDLSIKVKLLASRPTRRNLSQAIDILEALNERLSLTLADQFQLVQLYLAQNNWSLARDTMLGLMASQSHQPDLLSSCVRIMLDHGEVEGMSEQWLRTLIQLEPDEFRTLDLRIRALIAGNQIDKAIALLQSELEAEGREPDELVDFRESAAASLNELALKFEVSGRLAHAQRLSSYAEDLYRSVYK